MPRAKQKSVWRSNNVADDHSVIGNHKSAIAANSGPLPFSRKFLPETCWTSVPGRKGVMLTLLQGCGIRAVRGRRWGACTS